jgi:hypothetical protein
MACGHRFADHASHKKKATEEARQEPLVNNTFGNPDSTFATEHCPKNARYDGGVSPGGLRRPAVFCCLVHPPRLIGKQ